ncbi:MAG: family 10 glycosylhydrolase [Chloroflexota bacterium]|nr:family 10 glycosylhydrolase [Chloroflexota bacterium]
MSTPVIAIQVGAVSFIDEGVPQVLDIFQERGGVNALFLATPTWTRGTGGRQLPGHAVPDHGAQEHDLDWVGGNYATVHPEYYGGTILGPAGHAPEHPDWDIFAEVLPEAKARGMQSFAWMEESSYAPELRRYPNFPKCLEVDAWGRPAPRFCFNNPDYRNWHLSIVEDYAKSYELDGLAWCSERPGPLNMLMQGPVLPSAITCFCPYCQAIGRERGIDVGRAQEGYRQALDWNARVASGDRPRDGAFVSFWRLLLDYPELLAWQTLWTDSQHQLYRDIYGVANACNPDLQVGWHVYHNISFSPFYRADQDYEEMSRFSDFIKVVAYDNCAGPRFHTWVQNICHSIFADASPAEVYPLLLKLLQLDEAPYEELPATGFSADYVRRETERAVAAVDGRCLIYPGIDLDIPTRPRASVRRDKPVDALGTTGIGGGDIPDDVELAQCTREGVKEAVLAAFAGGAQGVVLSRKYSEMRLDILSGAGDAVSELS